MDASDNARRLATGKRDCFSDGGEPVFAKILDRGAAIEGAEIEAIRSRVARVLNTEQEIHVLIRAGDTLVLCTASVDESLPPWMKKDGSRGWVTAEYNMLPGSTSPRKPREQSSGIAVIVETDGSKAALLVDELVGQQQVVVKSLETNFRKVPGLSGATVMGDGSVALILDVAHLVRLSGREGAMLF